jgi:hypothetical protein
MSYWGSRFVFGGMRRWETGFPLRDPMKTSVGNIAVVMAGRTVVWRCLLEYGTPAAGAKRMPSESTERCPSARLTLLCSAPGSPRLLAMHSNVCLLWHNPPSNEDASSARSWVFLCRKVPSLSSPSSIF